MKNMMKKTASLLFVLVLTTGLSQRACFANDAPDALPLVKVMEVLADYKTFRMNSASFDKLVLPYCKKTDSMVDELEILYEYKCKAESGIEQIKINSREIKNEKNYMMYVTVFFSSENYKLIKSQLEKKLGASKKSGADFISWKYNGDKNLNEHGNPIIRLSRDPADKSATFQLALEQGP